ncbi:MAG: hypothetical protein KatS3mg126_0487 [Lysobacteraceae bacterium]|nr:MAG: hypothetical protein KatS3mg126_0487 [Xanthomonadaceae bacterium]
MSADPFVEFPAGTPLLREGETASALFILESGKAVVQRADAPGVVLAELGPGDFCGEMSILQEQPHTATVVASTPVRALRIEVAAFHAVLRENVEVAVQLMRRLVLRLKESEARRARLEARLAADRPGTEAARPAPRPPAATPQATRTQAAALPVCIEHAGGRIPLPGGRPELLIGRPDPATGAVPDVNLGPLDATRTLSRRHARLLVGPDGTLRLREEPGVGNGTWVNGKRLEPGQEVAVKAGDSLRFGAIEVSLREA